MLRWLLAVFCLLFHAPGYSAERTLTFSMLERSPLAIEMLSAVAKAVFAPLGYQLRFVPAPGERPLQLLASGRIDGDLGRGLVIRQDYPQLLLLDEPSLRFYVTAFTRNDGPKIRELADLTPLRVAYLRGYKGMERMLADVEQRLPVTHIGQFSELLAHGRVDAVLDATLSGQPIDWHSERGTLHAHVLGQTAVRIALHPRHAGLLPAANAALRAMKADGRYAALHQALLGSAPLPAAAAPPR